MSVFVPGMGWSEPWPSPSTHNTAAPPQEAASTPSTGTLPGTELRTTWCGASSTDGPHTLCWSRWVEELVLHDSAMHRESIESCVKCVEAGTGMSAGYDDNNNERCPEHLPLKIIAISVSVSSLHSLSCTHIHAHKHTHTHASLSLIHI